MKIGIILGLTYMIIMVAGSNHNIITNSEIMETFNSTNQNLNNNEQNSTQILKLNPKNNQIPIVNNVPGVLKPNEIYNILNEVYTNSLSDPINYSNETIKPLYVNISNLSNKLAKKYQIYKQMKIDDNEDGLDIHDISKFEQNNMKSFSIDDVLDTTNNAIDLEPFNSNHNKDEKLKDNNIDSLKEVLNKYKNI